MGLPRNAAQPVGAVDDRPHERWRVQPDQAVVDKIAQPRGRVLVVDGGDIRHGRQRPVDRPGEVIETRQVVVARRAEPAGGAQPATVTFLQVDVTRAELHPPSLRRTPCDLCGSTVPRDEGSDAAVQRIVRRGEDLVSARPPAKGGAQPGTDRADPPDPLHHLGADGPVLVRLVRAAAHLLDDPRGQVGERVVPGAAGSVALDALQQADRAVLDEVVERDAAAPPPTADVLARRAEADHACTAADEFLAGGLTAADVGGEHVVALRVRHASAQLAGRRGRGLDLDGDPVHLGDRERRLPGVRLSVRVVTGWLAWSSRRGRHIT